MFVVDIKREHNAVAEARKLKIPVVAIVDTNCDPDLVDYPIAGNDDAIRSVRMILATIAQVITRAQAEFESEASAPQAEEEAEAAPTGRQPSAAAAPTEAAPRRLPAQIEREPSANRIFVLRTLNTELIQLFLWLKLLLPTLANSAR